MKKRKLPLLTREMAEELAFELKGLQGSADTPEQYDEKIQALFAIADGVHRVVRSRQPRPGADHA